MTRLLLAAIPPGRDPDRVRASRRAALLTRAPIPIHRGNSLDSV